MVTGKLLNGFYVELRDETHTWHAGLDRALGEALHKGAPKDAPAVGEALHKGAPKDAPALGGVDEAPDPHRLLESALAACTILTAQLYANRKGWPLEGTDAFVKIVAEGPEGNRIQRGVKFRGALTEEQRARLLEIVNQCPVHRFLERGAKVETITLAP
jgi:putative redox protein